MALRGQHYRDAIRAVMNVFGESVDDFVFLGSCVLGLYMRPTGGPFRPTIDADVISTLRPWSSQAKKLAQLCERGLLEPDQRIVCRYHLSGSRIAVDVLSPEGKNVGNITPWFLRAAERAAFFPFEDDVQVRAVTPPYFLVLKLEAWRDRGEDAASDKDAEDIVAVATEVLDLPEQLEREGILAEVGELMRSALEARHLTTEQVGDLVLWHLHPMDAAEEHRVVASLLRCARGA